MAKQTNWESREGVEIKDFKTLYQFAGYKSVRVDLNRVQARVVLEVVRRYRLRCLTGATAATLNCQPRSEAKDLPLGPIKEGVIEFPVIHLGCSG